MGRGDFIPLGSYREYPPEEMKARAAGPTRREAGICLPHTETIVKSAIGTFFVFFLLLGASSAFAQETADPSDVGTLDDIIRAYYEVVSGPAGALPDRARDQSLHVPGALVGVPGVDENGVPQLMTMTLDDYHDSFGDARAEGFYEKEIHRVVHRFGNVAQVWSTYSSARTPGGEPFDRGINSIQLTWDGTRWWVVSWIFDAERPDQPIPPEFLPEKGR